MRAHSDALAALVNSKNIAAAADLITLDLRYPLGLDSTRGVAASSQFTDGTLCRWTTGDSNLMGFSCRGPVMQRGGVRHAAGTEVGTMTLGLGGGWTFPNGTKIQAAAILGQFDGAAVKVERLLMPLWGDTSAGTVNWFEGVVSTVEPSSTQVKLTFKDLRTTLNQPYPRRLYQPGCPYALFDSCCGVQELDGVNRFGGYVRGPPDEPTLTAVAIDASYPVNAFIRGRVRFDTGPLTGVSRTVIYSADLPGSHHGFRFAAALPSIPAAGTHITFWYGCDGTKAMCVSRFMNGKRFGGFPYVPKPESVR